MPKIILHQIHQSHFCIRIRWLLRLKKIPHELKNYTYTTMEPLEKATGGWDRVPVLQWDDRYIVDSPHIARFLEEQVPEPKIYTAPAALCDIANGWIDTRVMLSAAKFLVPDFMNYLGNDADRAIYEDVFKSVHGLTVAQASARREEFRKDMEEQWKLLEELLTKSPYVLGSALSYSDLAFASRFRLMEIAGNYRIPPQFLPIAAWYSRVQQAIGNLD